MSVKSVKPRKSSNSSKCPKPANKPKSLNNQVPDKPLTPLLTVDACPTIPKNRGNNGDNGDSLISTKSDDPSVEWDLSKAMTLRLKHNLSYEQLASHFNVPSSTICDRFKALKTLLSQKDLTTFREHEADLVDSAKATLLSEISDTDRLKGASINNIGYVWDKLALHSRLLADKSTVNIEIHVEPGMQDHIDSVATSYSDKLLADAAQCDGDTDDTD